MASSNLHCS